MTREEFDKWSMDQDRIIHWRVLYDFIKATPELSDEKVGRFARALVEGFEQFGGTA